MNYNSLYKLAFAQDPTVAVASAAAAVGLPFCAVKLAGKLDAITRGLQAFGVKGIRAPTQLPRQARRAFGRIGRGAPSESLTRNRWRQLHAQQMDPTSAWAMTEARSAHGMANAVQAPTMKAPPLAITRKARAQRATQQPAPGVATTPAASAAEAAAPQGIGRRIMKDWWTIPVGAAGAYGVAHGVGAMADGLGGDAGGDMQMGYGYPAAAQTPAQGRYEQMMSLARRYGYS